MMGDGLVTWLRSLRRRSAAEDSRLNTVRQAVTAAADSVDGELAALRAQLQADRDRACLALDNEDGNRFEREAADERALCDAEDRIRIGTERMNRLRRLRATFREVRFLLDGNGAPVSPAADNRAEAPSRPRWDAPLTID